MPVLCGRFIFSGILMGLLFAAPGCRPSGNSSHGDDVDPASETRMSDTENPIDISRFGRSIWESDESPSVQPAPSVPVRGNGIPVLCYHEIFRGSNTFQGFNVTPQAFEEQLKYLSTAGYRTVSLDDFFLAMKGEKPSNFPEKAILLTFDDGFVSNYTEVAPLLRKYGFKGVLFLYPSIISSTRSLYMRWDKVREIVKEGIFEPASHTYWHPMLPGMTREDIRFQLVKSKETLEKELGVTVRDLAYPFGLYDTRVIEEAKAAGYRMAFTINPGANRPGENLFLINRYMLSTDQTLAAFKQKLEMETIINPFSDPPEGSKIRMGSAIRLRLPGIAPESLVVKMRGRQLAVTRNGDEFVTQTQNVSSGNGYLLMTIRARTANGENVYRQMLFMDETKFNHQAAGQAH